MGERTSQRNPSHQQSPIGEIGVEQLTEIVWSELQLSKIDYPFKLPPATAYKDITHFITTELMIQTEGMRSDIQHKMNMVQGPPKDATEHKRLRNIYELHCHIM